MSPRHAWALAGGPQGPPPDVCASQMLTRQTLAHLLGGDGLLFTIQKEKFCVSKCRIL